MPTTVSESVMKALFLMVPEDKPLRLRQWPLRSWKSFSVKPCGCGL
jgi:hypothetical protein